MPGKRRRAVFRTPEQRLRLWDRKLEPVTYSVYLEHVKDLARDKFAQYQVVHEHLIRIVKEVTSKYPSETARQHAYLWFAQQVWYCTQRYSGEALLREVGALLIYWHMLGLREHVTREICARLGIYVPDLPIVLERYAPDLVRDIQVMVIKYLQEAGVIKERVQLIDRLARMLTAEPPVIGKVTFSPDETYPAEKELVRTELDVLHYAEGYIDLSALATGESIELRYYVALTAEREYKLYARQVFRAEDLAETGEKLVYIVSRPAVYGLRITAVIEQPPAETRELPYNIYIFKL